MHDIWIKAYLEQCVINICLPDHMGHLQSIRKPTPLVATDPQLAILLEIWCLDCSYHLSLEDFSPGIGNWALILVFSPRYISIWPTPSTNFCLIKYNLITTKLIVNNQNKHKKTLVVASSIVFCQRMHCSFEFFVDIRQRRY